jgi:hypothetical protein
MPIPPFAHLGHWYVSLPVFMGPVLVLVIALKAQTWREARASSERSDKRSHVTATQSDGGGLTIAVSGPLDYPALVEIETELGRAGGTGGHALLDLRGLTAADQEAAWGLCDALGRAHAGAGVRALIEPDPAMHALRAICAQEGIQLLDRSPAAGAG